MSSPRPRPRVRMSAAQRREQLLEITTALIAQRGYWGLSLQGVADAGGLTLPGVLHHFGSKDGLLVAVLEYRDMLDRLALRKHLGLEADLWDMGTFDAPGLKLTDVCDAIVERNANQREIVRLYTILQAESLPKDHPAHSFFAARRQRVLAQLSHLAPEVADREVLARHVLALLDGLQIQWLADPDMDLVETWRAASRQIPHLSGTPGRLPLEGIRDCPDFR